MVVAGAIVAIGGGPLLHAEARLEDELLRLAPSGYAADDGAAAVFDADGFVEAIAQRDGASVWRVDRDGSQPLETRRL